MGIFLCKMSFDLSSMKRGELCHDQCMGLLPDYMQDIGAAKGTRPWPAPGEEAGETAPPPGPWGEAIG